MRASRIYTQASLAVDCVVSLDGSTGHYLARVLRTSEGDQVVLFNGDGFDYQATVTKVDRQSVSVQVSGATQRLTESPLRVTLVQAIGRGERMDFTLQKATELGVYAIQPLLSERVGIKLDEKRQSKRVAHWQGVVVSACEQSGRSVIPQVFEPLTVSAWLEKNAAQASPLMNLILDPEAGTSLVSAIDQMQDLAILIGPEGGFSQQGLDQVESNGGIAASLGPRVLRTETAGPAAIAVLQATAGDF